MSTSEEELIDLEDLVEEVDALPVRFVASARQLSSRRALPTAAQAAAVAVTGFAAGAVAAAVVQRSRAKRPGLSPARRAAPGNDLVVSSTRSFLVDVHLLAPRD